MCGRFTLRTPPELLQAHFGLAERPGLVPRYNIAPGQPVAVVRVRGEARHLDLMRWGLIPGWAKEPNPRYRMINARAETLAERPAYRAAYRYRRCLVPADGFYEWQARAGGAKQPWFFHRPDDAPFGIAGLWEHWQGADGSEIESVVLITVPANRRIARLHDRMPAILPPAAYAAWLDPRLQRTAELDALLRPAPETLLEGHPVSRRVNRTDQEGPGLIAPVAETAAD